ncbi:amino acid permease [Dokdonella sp.]|uniref:amino acid permease n=1 Tax=Dokdonella sp. TaxID=2291710 RepID=UPI002F3FE4E3
MPTPNDPPRAALGLATAVAIVAGNMIGSGLFLLPASLAPYGPAALLGWGASALGGLALAFVFADLGRRLPRSGGPYAFARAAFGDGAGFAIAWSYWVSIWCANAAIAVAFAGYLGSLFPPAASATGAPLAALGALWACTLANALGVRRAGAVQLVTTVLKLLPLAALVVFAAPELPRAHWQPFNRSGESLWSVALATTALTLWAFLGVESATVVAQDVAHPRRNLPRATLAGSAIAIVVTVLACTVVAAIVPADALGASSAPFADAASRLWGGKAGMLFAATAAVACFGALNGWVLLQGQLPLAAARDGVLPAWFARVDARGTPLQGLVAGSALASALVLADYRQDLVGVFTFSILLSTAACLLPYVVCSAAALWGVRGASTSGARAVAAFAFVFSIAALAGTGADALLWGTVLVAAGWPIRWYLRRTSRVNRAATPR